MAEHQYVVTFRSEASIDDLALNSAMRRVVGTVFEEEVATARVTASATLEYGDDVITWTHASDARALDDLSDWLIEHPEATYEEIAQQAARALTSTGRAVK